jgi:integrative and conjugative element protein (TIGR02256 family)
MQVWKSECGTYTVFLEADFLEKSYGVAKKHLPKESGSTLVGSYSDDGRVARISGIGPISIDSAGTAFSFTRGVNGVKKYFAKLFKETGGITHYLGEWHSHPNGYPRPSRTDEINMVAIANDHKMMCPECILVILGIYKQRLDVGVFVFSRSRGNISLVQEKDNRISKKGRTT